MKDAIYRLKLPDDVAELIRGMHPHLKKKIRFSLRQILKDPNSGKALKDELASLLSLRVGNFRIIYRHSKNKIIEIVAVGPRKNIYEETYRIVQKEFDVEDSTL